MSIEVSGVELESALKAIVPFASTDATSPMLNAVQLRVVGQNLQVVATDRYTFGVYRVSAASDDNVIPHEFEVLVSVDVVKRILPLLKGLPKWAPAVRLERTELDSLRVILPSGLATFDLVGEQFPSISVLQSILEQAKANVDSPIGGEGHGYNSKFLARFDKVADKGTPVVLWPSKAGKPALVTVGDNFIGAICQVRQGDGFSIPSWLDDTSVTPAAAVA